MVFFWVSGEVVLFVVFVVKNLSEKVNNVCCNVTNDKRNFHIL